MKKLMILSVAFLITGSVTMAQSSKTKSKKSTAVKVTVPQNVKEAYTTTYPTASNAIWAKTVVGNYKVTQELENGEKQTIEYNNSGEVMNSTTVYQNDLVPETIVAGIQAKYSGAIIEEANKVELPGIVPYYTVKIKTADCTRERQLYVSEQGLVSL